MARYLWSVAKTCFNHTLFMKKVVLLVCWLVCLFVLYPRCLFFSLVWLLQRWWGFRTAVPVLSKRLVLLEYGGGLDVWTHSTVGRDSAEKGRRRGGWKYVSVLESQMSNATICLCLWVFACAISYMDRQMHKHTRKHLVREVVKGIVKQQQQRFHKSTIKVNDKSWSWTTFLSKFHWDLQTQPDH